uniref:Uncharacterized protein n=1 Tax=Arundo donax TaxID=35708 RepID=A0A0A9HX12_ARUDO
MNELEVWRCWGCSRLNFCNSC